MRYTEARLTKAAVDLMEDLDKETVDFIPNYDESEHEPEILPARLPNLLVNGSYGKSRPKKSKKRKIKIENAKKAAA